MTGEEKYNRMRISELIDDIEDTIESASTFPLTGKVMLSADEMKMRIDNLRVCLPEDIKKANWIAEREEALLQDCERQCNNRIAEVEELVNKRIAEAEEEAARLVDTDTVTVRAKREAENIMKQTRLATLRAKHGTYEYIEKTLLNFKNHINDIKMTYFNRIFNEIGDLFDHIQKDIEKNLSEVDVLEGKIKEQWEAVDSDGYAK